MKININSEVDTEHVKQLVEDSRGPDGLATAAFLAAFTAALVAGLLVRLALG